MPSFGGLGAAAGGWLEAIEQQQDIENKRLQSQRQRQQLQSGNRDIAAQGGLARTLSIIPFPGAQPQDQSQQGQQGQQGQQRPQAPVALPAGATSPQPTAQQPVALTGGAAGAGGLPAGAGAPQPMASQPQQPLQQARQPQQQGQPQQGQRQQDQGQQGVRLGTMTAAQLMSYVKRANPGQPDWLLERVMNGLLPWMKIEEQSAWREAQLASKAADRAERARQFDQKEIDVREKHELAINAFLEKARHNVTDEQRKSSELELKQLTEQHNTEIKQLREARLREGLDLRREDQAIKREGIESRERITERKGEQAIEQITAKGVVSERIQGMKGEQQLGAIGAKGEETRKTQAQRDVAAGERLDKTLAVRQEEGALNRVSREALAGMKDDTYRWSTQLSDDRKREISAATVKGKLDVAQLSADTRKEISQFQADQRQQIVKYVQAQAAERQQARIASQEKIAEKRLDAMKTRGDQMIALSMERLGLRKDQVFGVDADRQAKLLADKGVTGDEIQKSARCYNLTYDDKKCSMAGLTGLTKSTFGRAMVNVGDEILKAEGKDPTKERIENAARVKDAEATMKRFLGAGPQGDQIRFLSVAQSHMRTAEELLDQWRAGAYALGSDDSFVKLLPESPIAAKIYSYITTFMGRPEATNIHLMAQVLGTEIIKSLAVARAGTAQERQEIAERFNTGQSWQQFQGALDSARKLLGGQLEGFENSFAGSVSILMDRQHAVDLLHNVMTKDAVEQLVAKQRVDPNWKRPWQRGSSGSWNPDDYRSKGNKNADRLDLPPDGSDPTLPGNKRR